MVIRTADGGSQSVASNATGNLGVTLGAIGTGLSILNGGANMLGIGTNKTGCSENQYITRYEANMLQELQAKDILLAQKDAQLALKESESYTDKKMVEVYEALKVSENQLRAEVRQNKDAQQAINAQQMAWNASTGVTMATLGQQIAQVQSIVTSVVPASKVCDTGCCCNN